VSTPDHWRVGVVGAGRVGAVLGAALAAAGHEVVAVSGSSAATEARVAELLPGRPFLAPDRVARGCDLLLLTVPDDVLATVVRELEGAGAVRPGQLVVHAAGRHGLGVLQPLADLGARPLALHPTMTFTGTARDLPRLRGCPVAVTVADADRGDAERLVADLGGRAFALDDARRELYHAGTVHGANHLVTLVAEARELLGAAGVDDPGAALRPLLEAALDNSLRSGDAALTGPVVRGDVGTVRAHLARVAEAAPATVPSYAVLARSTLRRVVADGRLPREQGERIEELLVAAGRGTP